MLYINIHDAKTNLSKYLEQITDSNSTIVICNNNKPVACLSKYMPLKKRVLGLWKGKVKIDKDFDKLPDEFMKYFQ